MPTLRCLVILLLATTACVASAQERRPIPYPVLPPPAFEQAVGQGTRTLTGQPGAAYWTNRADYTIDATLTPATQQLDGQVTIRYQNNSPDTLRQFVVHLRQNLYREGAVRNRNVPITGGMDVAGVTVDGQRLVEQRSRGSVGYTIDNTLMRIFPPAPLAPGAETTLAMTFGFAVPPLGASRMGQDGEVYYLGYWYPQMAVYDDLVGWKAEPYQGNGEFYMGYGDYDVRLTVPEGWLVGATGTLANADAVLTPQAQDALAAAASSDAVVAVIDTAAHAASRVTRPGLAGLLTWHFTAENVRDFAFGTSAAYVWDATRARVGDRDGDGASDYALIHALYRPGTAAWDRSAEFARFSIEHLSDMLLPYPYPQMTTVEGILGGGMEYPMITLIGGDRTPQSLFSVTYHEISHMWFPMVVGQDEKQFTWMDEGTTSFNTNEGFGDFWNVDAWQPGRQSYYRIAGTGDEVESMRHADDYPYGTAARGIASYNKPAVAFHALRGILGDARFFEAYRTYAERWAYKHPQPYDLFNTFEDVTGDELDWFWTSLFYETWTLDHAVAAVESTDEGVTVTIADEGVLPMPVLLRVTYADGSIVNERVPVDTWLDGTTRRTTVQVNPGTVVRVELDPEGYLPDIDRSDNTWQP